MAASTSGEDIVSSRVPMVVIFGRAGAGKSTVADAALRFLREQESHPLKLSTIALDLDFCVPQWMRDDFGKGIYPTLEQRRDFALTACDYVESELSKPFNQCEFASSKPLMATAAIISFSFVNVDMRDIFRERFPCASWALMDVTDETAKQRVEMRVGHFYKGPNESATATATSEEEEERRNSEAKILGMDSQVSGEDGEPSQENERNSAVDNNNNEWEFAHVTFPQITLDGLEAVEVNARKVIEALDSMII